MTMRIVLLFPPVTDPCQPYLSLPALTSFLRRAGYPVAQRDLNVEAYEAFLSPTRLQESLTTIAGRLAQLEAKAGLSDAERAHYAVLAQARLTAPALIEHVEEAKQVLRSPAGFYDFERYRWSIRTLDLAMALISAEYYPTEWQLDRFQTRHTEEKAWPASGLLEMTQDESENPFVRFFREQVVPSLQSGEPDLIGISVTYPTQLVPGLTLANEIKRALPQKHVCLGGAALTDLSGCLEEAPELFRVMDSVITHEGEHALLALAQRLEHGAPLTDVPNLVYLAPSGEVLRTPLGPVEDVNALPTPDYTGLPLSLYLAPEPVFLLATSRGCYWKRCAFCAVSTAARSSCYRPRARELVKQDIQMLVSRHQARQIFLSEDSVAPNRLRMMAEIAQELGYALNWECETRLEGLSEELCHQIASAGCRRLTFGLEAATQRVLDLMDKGTRVETVEDVLRHCQSAGIAVNLQSFVGFPGETEAEARQTLHFLLENRDRILAVAFGHFLLQPGSKVAQDPTRFGVTHIEYPPRGVLAMCYDYQVSTGMTSEQAKRLRAEGLREIQKAFGYLSSFHGHDVGPHSFLYLLRYGAQAMRNLPSGPPMAAIGPDFPERVPVVATGIVCRPQRQDGNGCPLLLVFNARSAQVLRTDLATGRLLDLCDGQASVGQIADRLARQGVDTSGYLRTYYQALSLTRACVQSGILELQ